MPVHISIRIEIHYYEKEGSLLGEKEKEQYTLKLLDKDNTYQSYIGTVTHYPVT